MPSKWRLKLINPHTAIVTAVYMGWKNALVDLESWMHRDLVTSLVYGGHGIQGITDTPFFHFISSPRGMAELGISILDIAKLTNAYESTFSTSKSYTYITFKFGDVAKLKLFTPHPRANQGNLHISSWLEWVVDGIPVNDAGFVPKTALPNAVRKFSLNGGLMLPKGKFGSTGTWSFPSQFRNYAEDWFAQNVSKIEKAIVNQMIVFLNQRLK